MVSGTAVIGCPLRLMTIGAVDVSTSSTPFCITVTLPNWTEANWKAPKGTIPKPVVPSEKESDKVFRLKVTE